MPVGISSPLPYAINIQDWDKLFPQKSRNNYENDRHLKFFVGVVGHQPEDMVRSDAAGEITSAVEELGWHPQPSLANQMAPQRSA